jgi:TPR repeat protein
VPEIDWNAEMAALDASLPERLERLALMAETANYWTDEHRLMPATGVADILYDALDEIERYRRLDVERAIELLERIAAHDHQAAATRVLLNAPSGTDERLAAYANSLREVAHTDIQGWAQMALLHLRGEDQ